MNKRKFAYTYMPGIHDACNPLVLYGAPIKAGTRVRIAREFNPPMFPTKVFAVIQDETGNVQTIYKKGLTK